MKKKETFRTIAYLLAACVILAGAFVLVTALRRSPKTDMYSMVVLGDSCFGNIRDDTSITAKLSEKLGIPVYNGAFGGTCAAKRDAQSNLDYSLDSLSLAVLSASIAADDFGPQQTMRTQALASRYFDEAVDALEQVDFKTVDTVFFAYGTNDFYGGVPLDNEKDAYDTTTYGGALRTAIRNFRNCNPGVRIILVTPTYSAIYETHVTCEEYDAGFGPLENYVKKLYQIAEEQQVELIDIYHDFYPHETWEDIIIYTFDGMHPLETGREMIAERITTYLKGESK